jgi:hypothetical protein
MRYVLLALLVSCLVGPGAWAQDEFERSGFWCGFNLGVGAVERSFSGVEEDDDKFFLGLEGGYTLNPHCLIGLELSGWLLESSNLEDPSKGESINQVFLISRFYPSSSNGLFAKVGGGYVNCRNNRPGEPSRRNGWGFTLGGGYDFQSNNNIAITPFITYSSGEADEQDHFAWTFGIGLTLQ